MGMICCRCSLVAVSVDSCEDAGHEVCCFQGGFTMLHILHVRDICWVGTVECSALTSVLIPWAHCRGCPAFLFEVLPADESPHEQWVPWRKDATWESFGGSKNPIQQPEKVYPDSPEPLPQEEGISHQNSLKDNRVEMVCQEHGEEDHATTITLLVVDHLTVSEED